MSFVAKPGETITGVGIDFATHLAAGETLVSVTIVPDSGLTVRPPPYPARSPWPPSVWPPTKPMLIYL